MVVPAEGRATTASDGEALAWVVAVTVFALT
jgi:hypothetical protein